MKFNFGRLVLWYFLYHFIIEGALRDLLIRGQTDSFDLTDSIFSITSLLIPFFYVIISYGTLHRYYPSRNWLYCSLGLLVAIIFTISLRYFIEQVITKELFQLTNYPHHYGVKNYIIDNYFYAFRYMTFGVIYYFVTYSLYKQKRESELLLSKQAMEMALLKSQINPHFLLNSMNNIYSLVFHKSDNALPAMDKLTDILKYSLYETKEFESLERELDIVQKYIGLAKLRTTLAWYYTIETDIKDTSILIPQHLLMPIVENTIKHGDVSSAEYPAITTIKKDGSKLHICSNNKIKTSLKDETGGIGLSNLERRLQLLYDNDYTMDSNLTADYYSLNIIIPIK